MSMPAALRVQLTREDHAELERRYETAGDAETRTRYQIVLLAAAGQTAPQIAPVVRRSVDTVRRVVQRYQNGDVGDVPHRPRPGRPPEVPAAWESELCRVIELDPHTVGVDSANWTTRLLAAYLAQVTGHRTGIETVRMHLHKAGYVCKRPTWTLQRKADEQPEGAKNA
jgi:transposase